MPAGYATETTIMQTYFDTQWGTTTDVAWPDSTYVPKEDTEWVRFDIIPFDAFQANLAASPTYRRTGEVWISVFTPRNQGPNRNNVLVDLLVADYLDVLDDGVTYGVPRREPGTDTTWLHSIVKVPFRWDATT